MAQRTDDAIASDVRAELDANGLPLGVDVEAGRVRLSGEVTSEAERQAAIDLANWIEGVDEVQDDLTIIEYVENPAAIDELFIDDEQDDVTDDPQIAAAEGLTYIPPIDPPTVPSGDEPGYDVRGGFQTSSLEGQPDSAPRGPSELLDRVRRELKEDSATSDLQISIAASPAGLVVLRGWVEDRESSDAAEAVAGRVDGVQQVLNRTVVVRPSESVELDDAPPAGTSSTRHVMTASAAWRGVVATNRRRLRLMRQETRKQIAEMEEQIESFSADQEQEGTASSHSADLASDVEAMGRLQAELDAARHRLMEIDEALERFRQGRYGICVDTGQLIDSERLRANPMAIRTLAAQEQYEQRADV